jgi:hypothetical protein
MQFTLTTNAGTMAISGRNCASFFHPSSNSSSLLTITPGKDKKRVDKCLAQSKESESSSSGISPAELRDALEKVKNEEGPKTAEEKETYFMSQVGIGEQLALQG